MLNLGCTQCVSVAWHAGRLTDGFAALFNNVRHVRIGNLGHSSGIRPVEQRDVLPDGDRAIALAGFPVTIATLALHEKLLSCCRVSLGECHVGQSTQPDGPTH
jgi:hypothetical protein